MRSIKTLSSLQDFLDEELSWRIKEIADLNLSVRRSSELHKRTLTRAAIPLLYAHWEGFVKAAADGYLNFVNNQGLRYDELDYCFIVFGFKKQINDLSNSRKSHINISAIKFLVDQMKQEAQLKMQNAVETESNLSSTVFENIALSIGINTSPYQLRYKFIDEALLKRRNTIAHGSYLDLSVGDYGNLAAEVIALLRDFKTDIENSAAQEKYLRGGQGETPRA